MAALIIAGAILVVLILLFFGIYNRLIHLRNTTQESWRDIETELQRRHDLVPNLVDTVKGYAAHERQVLENVTQLREDAIAAKGPPDQQAPPEQALGAGVGQLMAVAERYPDLKASSEFLTLQRQLADTEDRIQVSRRIYNANVRAFNTLTQSFPSVIIAKMFGFAPLPFFELEPMVAADSGPPSVDLRPGS